MKLAETDREIQACFAVMHELRPHLEPGKFESQVQRLHELYGFRLAFLEDGEVMCVAGIRIGEWLHQGRYLEIEDFVTRPGFRSRRYGGDLFDWIADYGRSQACVHLRLLSGVARKDAHRFYERKGMQMLAHYFSMDL
jgi:GNAT superfamily N-acetyltransferase